MKKYAVSVSGGSVAWKHNKRITHTANVEPALSKHNVIIKDCHNLKQAFNDFYAPFVEAYNEKQKRKDRQVTDYYNEIESSNRKESACYEYVIQIGNRDNNPLVQRDENGKIISWGADTKATVEILKQYAEEFEKNNPQFHVLQATIHCDEIYTKDPDTGERVLSTGCPHLHIIYTPFATGYSQKLETRCARTKSLEQMGYAYDKETRTEGKVLWKRAQEQIIEQLMKEKGFEREYKEGRTERIANGVYQTMRAQMDKKLSGLNSEIASAQQTVDKITPIVRELSEVLPEDEIADITRGISEVKRLSDYEQAQYTNHRDLEISKQIVKERVR